MLCSELMLSYVYSVGPADTAGHCARLMVEGKIGFVPVLDPQGRPLGVITDRDLAVRVLAEELPATTPIGAVMSPGPLLTCGPDEDVMSLAERMAEQKRARAIVVDDFGHCVGIISLSDLAHVGAPADAGRLLDAVSRREAVQIVRT